MPTPDPYVGYGFNGGEAQFGINMRDISMFIHSSPFPSAPAAGLHMYAMAMAKDTTIVSGPAGWTLISSGTIAGTTSYAIWHKVAGGSEPTSYAFHIPINPTGWWTVQIITADADGGTPTIGTAQTGTGNLVTAPAVGSGYAHNMVMVMATGTTMMQFAEDYPWQGSLAAIIHDDGLPVASVTGGSRPGYPADIHFTTTGGTANVGISVHLPMDAPPDPVTTVSVVAGCDSSPFIRFYETDSSTGAATTLMDPQPALPVAITHACVAKWNRQATVAGEPMFLAILEASVGLHIWKWDGSAFTALSLVQPTTFRAHSGNSLAWDRWGKYLAVGGVAAASIATAYRVIGTTVTKVATLTSTGAPNGCLGVSWSQDYWQFDNRPKYLAFAVTVNPQIEWFRFEVPDAFTRMPTPPSLPSTQCRSIAFVANGLVAGSNNTPWLHSWSFDYITEILTKRANPSTLPDASVEAVSPYPTTTFLVGVGQIPGASAKTLRFYSFGSNSFYTLAATQPPSSVFDVGWLYDKPINFEGNFNSPRLARYDFQGAVPIRDPLPDVTPTFTVRSASWGPSLAPPIPSKFYMGTLGFG